MEHGPYIFYKFTNVFIILFKEKLDKSGADVEAKKNKIQGLEMYSERLKEEIVYLEEDIKQTVSNKEKVLCAALYSLIISFVT